MKSGNFVAFTDRLIWLFQARTSVYGTLLFAQLNVAQFRAARVCISSAIPVGSLHCPLTGANLHCSVHGRFSWQPQCTTFKNESTFPVVVLTFACASTEIEPLYAKYFHVLLAIQARFTCRVVVPKSYNHM